MKLSHLILAVFILPALYVVYTFIRPTPVPNIQRDISVYIDPNTNPANTDAIFKAREYSAKGIIFYNAGNFDSAAFYFKKHLEIDDANSLMWNNLCASYNNQQKFVEAADAGLRAVRIDPTNKLAINNLKISLPHLSGKLKEEVQKIVGEI